MTDQVVVSDAHFKTGLYVYAQGGATLSPCQKSL
jgi:hypothetical protein